MLKNLYFDRTGVSRLICLAEEGFVMGHKQVRARQAGDQISDVLEHHVAALEPLLRIYQKEKRLLYPLENIRF